MFSKLKLGKNQVLTTKFSFPYDSKFDFYLDFEHLGCFWDPKQNGGDRTFEALFKDDPWGMTPTKCYEFIMKKGDASKYPIFGVQV